MEAEKQGEACPQAQETPKQTRPEGVYDNTMIQEFLVCQRKFFLKYIKNWRRGKSAPALEWGRAYHKIVELLLTGRENEIEEVIQAYQDYPDDSLRTREKLRRALATFKTERMPVRWEQTIAVEQAITLPIEEFTFAVNPDTVIKWRGATYGYERKHTGRITENYFNVFSRATQVDAQMLAIEKEFGSCNGIYIEATLIRKGGPTSKLKEVEIFTDIAQRDKTSLATSRQYFLDWMRRIRDEKVYPENRQSCFAYGRGCEYLPFCQGKVENPEEYYQIEVWNPLNRGGNDVQAD